jgi:hypothetical protein
MQNMLMPGTAIVTDLNTIINCILLAVFRCAMLPIFDEYMIVDTHLYGVMYLKAIFHK